VRNNNGIFAFYGALELKKSYQRNMSLGILFALVLHFMIIGGVLLYMHFGSRPQEMPREVIPPGKIIKFAPPPLTPTGEFRIPVKTPPSILPAKGLPKAVPDEQAPVENNFPTQKELGIFEKGIQDVIAGGTVDSIVASESDKLPALEDFVPHDVEPMMIEEALPTYPELARKAGIEGVVYVTVVVDKRGKVRDAKIEKPSGANAGFEEAALEAAYKNEFKPALANNEPVACPVTYRVEFKLK
jgi:protein TonB